MTTKQQREAVAAVKAWCKKNKVKLVGGVRHVYPRSYVVGHAAPLCLIVAECWADSEPQVFEFNRKHPLATIYRFDPSLKAGDWCITAYITTAGTGERVAVPIKERS
jgi:hypothetical protein